MPDDCIVSDCCPPSDYGYMIDSGTPNVPPIAEYLLEIGVDPTDSGTTTGAGTYQGGQFATITAAANEGFTFSAWSGDFVGTTNPAQVYMDGNKSIEALFEVAQVGLEIVSIPEIGGTTTGGGQYAFGDTANLEAFPEAYYNFEDWTGDLVSTNNPETLLMDGNKSVVANFSIQTFDVIVVSSGVGVTSGGGNYIAGNTATLFSTPGTGYYFSEYTGDVATADNPTNVLVDSNKNVTAIFLPITCPFDFPVSGENDEFDQTYPIPYVPSGQTIRINITINVYFNSAHMIMTSNTAGVFYDSGCINEGATQFQVANVPAGTGSVTIHVTPNCDHTPVPVAGWDFTLECEFV